ncbi:MAG: response regulator transcription factor [Bacteroidota bacterium]|nr:response regulator transcription factor [Bacteroidota bacterium]
MNVLIVEDEKELAHEIKFFLKNEGFICELAYNGKEASEKIFVNSYDFLLLDLGLPDYEGLDLLKEATEIHNEVAILIISARGDVDDRIKGLDLGADDYLAKPFSLLELKSRMMAVYRRKHGYRKNNIRIRDFSLDLDERVLHYKNEVVSLTRKEFDILSYLLLHKERVVNRLQLTEHIWGNILEEEVDSNYIDVHVKNLRKKLSAFEDIDWLVTVRGIGYKISE